MRVARISRPGAIYDASPAAQMLPGGELLEISEQGVEILGNAEKGVSPSEKKEDFEHMPGGDKFTGGRKKDVSKVNLLKKNKEIDTSETHFTVQNLIFLKKGNS